MKPIEKHNVRVRLFFRGTMFLGTVFLQTVFLGCPNLCLAFPSQPNVLVILCDDLGYGDLGCYGHPVIQTLNLDRLASQGIRLTSCYSAAPVCSSSRAGLLCGRTPDRMGIYDWIPNDHVMHLRADEVTVATLLSRRGYQTAHVGKWHLNGKFNSSEQPQPGDHGFGHWFSTQNNAAPSHKNPTNFVRNGKSVGPLSGFSCQLVADEAIDWLKHRSQEMPFFLFTCFHEPHEPVASPQELVQKYLPQSRNEDEAQYFANVANMDVAVGRLMKALDELDLDESTLVLFTSDNGPETLNRYRGSNRSYGSPGQLRGMKLWLYEAGIRVPGLIRWTGQIEPGQTVDQPVCGVDLLPTLCELAGIPVRDDLPDDRSLDGTSMVPLFRGEKIVRQQPLSWHYFAALGKAKAALRVDNWMLLGHRVSPTTKLPPRVNEHSMAILKATQLGDFELFDVVNDQNQENDLAEQQPERVERMSRQLVERHKQVQAEGPTWEFPSP